MAIDKILTTDRISAIDAIRGIAAIQVLILHVLTAYYPALIQTQDPPQIINYLHYTPIGFLYDGLSAVFIFFMLSGIVLRLAFQSYQYRPIAIIVSRFARLFLPVALACLFSAAIFLLTGQVNADVGQLVNSEWFSILWNPEPGLTFLLRDIFLNSVLIGYADHTPIVEAYSTYHGDPITMAYVAPAWSLSVEFQGSLLVLALCGLNHLQRILKFAVVLMLILMFFRTYYICFIVGYYFTDYAISNRRFLPSRSTIALVILGLALCSFGGNRYLDFTSWICAAKIPVSMSCTPHYQKTIGAILLVMGLLSSLRVKQILSHWALVRAGKLSFSLYLVHWPILFGLSATVFVVCVPYLGLVAAKLSASLFAILFSLGAATLFVPIDDASTRISRWLRRRLSSARVTDIS